MASTSIDTVSAEMQVDMVSTEVQPLKSDGVHKKCQEIKTRCSIHDPPKRRKFMFDSSKMKHKKKSKNNAKTSSNAPLSLKKHKIVEQSRGTFAEVDISSPVRPNALKVKISSPPSPRPKTKSTAPSTQRIKSTPSIRGTKRKNVLIREEPRNASNAARSAAYEAAKAHQMSLDSGTPSIVKLMVYSHVSRVFWLGLPKDFCDAYLVKKKSDITLEDEHGDQFTVVYIPERHGLSGGWKKFAQKKKLHEGDALVLQRIGPKRLKVHIFRSAELLPKIQAECVSSLEIKKKQRNI